MIINLIELGIDEDNNYTASRDLRALISLLNRDLS
jgi:hypothetical protein